MFTVRVEPAGGQAARSAYSVYGCARYSVVRAEGRATLTLEQDGGREPQQVVVEAGGSAFVMNDRGETVDTVRVPKGA